MTLGTSGGLHGPRVPWLWPASTHPLSRCAGQHREPWRPRPGWCSAPGHCSWPAPGGGTLCPQRQEVAARLLWVCWVGQWHVVASESPEGYQVGQQCSCCGWSSGGAPAQAGVQSLPPPPLGFGLQWIREREWTVRRPGQKDTPVLGVKCLRAQFQSETGRALEVPSQAVSV